MATAVFKIHGMDCAEEVAALRAVLAPMAGVDELAFDVLNGKLTIDFADSTVTPAALVAGIAKTGMRAEPWRELSQAGDATSSRQWGRAASTAISGGLIAAAFVTHGLADGWQAAIKGSDGSFATSPVPTLLCLAAAVAGGWFVVPKAWRALLRLRPDMNLLMAVAVVGAILIHQYFEAATVAFLFALSLLLESRSVGRAHNAVAALMSLTPPTARVADSTGREVMTDVREVPLGSRVVVLPGEKIPLDGTLTKGETTVDQAPITGESVPVAKSPGSEVFAGTINQDGAIELVTTKPASDTTLARVIRMVGEARSKRSPSEQWVEQFARYYTPAVMALAVAVMVLPPLVGGGSWSRWFYEGLVLLVIACPCALVISTPVSIVAALAAAARRGVLVKGGAFMEAPSRLRAIALDKTGTLTEGRPEINTIVPLSGHTELEVLELAAAVEARSEHPLAKAVLRAAAARGIQPSPADDYQAIPGKGATASIAGRLIWLGSHLLLEARGQETPEMHERLEEMERDGSSVIVLGKNEHVCGFLALADEVRQEALPAIEQLRQAGIEHIVMLTGDNRGTAESVGRALAVDEVRAELLPEDKVAAIEDLVRRYERVAMVGDGVNDAPAMARAGLAIAMGAAGTDAALETADIALMGDDLRHIPWLMRHSRRTVSIIRQNIFAALGVKALFVVLTLAGHASLWAAIAADTGMSLLVVFNALRLLNPGR
jgi:Zn2+/Cd2+-exporting ATPase